jgi:hypothetical protein
MRNCVMHILKFRFVLRNFEVFSKYILIREFKTNKEIIIFTLFPPSVTCF